MEREITECFKAYKKKKIDEYTIMINDGIKIIPHRFIHKKKDKRLYKTIPYYSEESISEILEKAKKETEETGEYKVVNIPSLTTVDDHLVERLSPDNIDSRNFWEKATELFPLFSVCGMVPADGDITKEGADKQNFDMHIYMGAISHLVDFLNAEIERKNYTEMLEIGPGFGNVCKFVEETAPFVTYHAIDVNPLFEHPRIYQTDGSTIPSDIPTSLDFVYSINVFQHLSRKQRSSYYQQIYDRLVPGGEFLFSMFVVTPDNENWPAWGLKDNHGTFYTQFFRQLTEVDRIEDLKKELEDIGFQFENVSLYQDKTNSLTIKCIKI